MTKLTRFIAGNTTATLFEEWFSWQCDVAAARFGKCIFVMDGATAHKRQINKAPTKVVKGGKKTHAAFLEKHDWVGKPDGDKGWLVRAQNVGRCWQAHRCADRRRL